MTKKILSIDGGGIRGLIPALVLAEIEKRTSKPIAELFDLVAGTSTGGILAMGLTIGNADRKPRYAANDLAKTYSQRGGEIFKKSRWPFSGVFDELYDADGLETVLLEQFGNEPLGGSIRNVLVSSYDIHARKPYFFKSWNPVDAAVEMRMVGRATAASPTFFEPARVAVGGTLRALIDGGVFINNPAMSAYAESQVMFPGESAFVVSLGTGQLVRPIRYDDAKDWGKTGWVMQLLDVMFDGVSDAVDYQLRAVLGDEFRRLQIDLTTASDDLDDASAENIAALTDEAKRLIRLQKNDLDAICDRL